MSSRGYDRLRGYQETVSWIVLSSIGGGWRLRHWGEHRSEPVGAGRVAKKDTGAGRGEVPA